MHIFVRNREISAEYLKLDTFSISVTRKLKAKTNARYRVVKRLKSRAHSPSLCSPLSHSLSHSLSFPARCSKLGRLEIELRMVEAILATLVIKLTYFYGNKNPRQRYTISVLIITSLLLTAMTE